MAQITLISHVSFLKYKDQEREREQVERNPNKPKGKQLNADNNQAYLLIAGGILG